MLPLVWCSPNSPFCCQESSQQQHCCSQRFPGSPGFPERPGTQHASSQFSFSFQASAQISRGERERERKKRETKIISKQHVYLISIDTMIYHVYVQQLALWVCCTSCTCMAASLAFLASSSNGLVETDQCHVCSLSGVNLLNFDPFDATPALVLGHSLPLGGEDLRLFVTWVGMGATLISRQELANFEAVPKSWSLLSPLQSFPPKGQRLLFCKKTPNVPVRIFSWTTGV